MAFPDIKNAGILAGFVRWGWPYHGIIKGGTVGTTGQAHTQPLDSLGNGANWGWLIDYGMPAITLTPDEQAFATANHLEWRNYALIPGGYAYGTYIGDESFIHIDDKGDAWRVALAYSFPASNTLRITMTLQRFGWLRVDGEYTAPAPLTKTVDVPCTYIDLVDPFGGGAEGDYVSQVGKLQDVHTNGSKALIGVFLGKVQSPPYNLPYETISDLFSLVELTFTGAGGESGVSLYPSAVEIVPYTSLQERITNGAQTFSRYAYYDPSGVAKAVSLKIYVESSTSVTLFHYWILENGTTVDEFGWDASVSGSAWLLNATFGSLAAYVPPVDAANGIVPNVGQGNIIYPWRSEYDNRYQIVVSYMYPASATGLYYYGIHRLPSKASAFIATNDNATVHYGTVSTPIGPKTTALTANLTQSLVNFAYQRKTLDFSFDTAPIAYV